MEWDLYDHVDANGRNVIRDWSAGLEARERGKLEAKLNMLRQSGPDLPTMLLANTPEGNIQKLRVRGKVQLRPLLCQGPIDNDREFTLLSGAKEKDSKLIPSDAVKVAADARRSIIDDPDNRRESHETVD